MSTLQIALQNQTSSSQAYAYITGQALDKNNALFLLQSDGQTPYYPTSPSGTIQPLGENIAIPLGAPGNTVYVTIPHLAGARLWFSVGSTLDFYLNPGPGLVEPSVTNPSDSNISKFWDFCEFTYNSSQLYANISYVDFVSLPISMTLTPSSGAIQHVSGMPSNGLTTVANALKAQSASDGQPWGSTVVTNSDGTPLRALSPNSYITMNPSAFSNYFAPYVNSCWSEYTSTDLNVDTQNGSWGVVTGRVSGNTLTFDNGGGSFTQPSTADIFSCSTGPFAGGSPEKLAVGARLAAQLNRSVLDEDVTQPDVQPSEYYKQSPTNHYSRIVHSVNLDGRGYAFPYDDVAPNGGPDASGFVADGAPKLLTVAVGGAQATAAASEVEVRQKRIVEKAPKVGSAGGEGGSQQGLVGQVQKVLQKSGLPKL